MKMITNTFTKPGMLVVDSRPGLTRVSESLSLLKSEWGGGSAMCMSSSVARHNKNFLIERSSSLFS